MVEDHDIFMNEVTKDVKGIDLYLTMVSTLVKMGLGVTVVGLDLKQVIVK